jgi:hypothetical protein
LIRSDRASPEKRHHDQPPIGELIVADNGIAVIRPLALAAKPLEEVRRLDGSVQHAAGRIEPSALLREDRRPRVHDLDDVIGSDGERVV